jgi:hypothetical protein
MPGHEHQKARGHLWGGPPRREPRGRGAPPWVYANGPVALSPEDAPAAEFIPANIGNMIPIKGSGSAGSLALFFWRGVAVGLLQRRYIDNRLRELVGVSGAFGGSLRNIHGVGPIFRSSRNPMLRLFLSRKIADVRFRAAARRYRNEPATALVHFGMKRRILGHVQNMRPGSVIFEPGKPPQSN